MHGWSYINVIFIGLSFLPTHSIEFWRIRYLPFRFCNISESSTWRRAYSSSNSFILRSFLSFKAVASDKFISWSFRPDLLNRARRISSSSFAILSWCSRSACLSSSSSRFNVACCSSWTDIIRFCLNEFYQLNVNAIFTTLKRVKIGKSSESHSGSVLKLTTRSEY